MLVLCFYTQYPICQRQSHSDFSIFLPVMKYNHIKDYQTFQKIISSGLSLPCELPVIPFVGFLDYLESKNSHRFQITIKQRFFKRNFSSLIVLYWIRFLKVFSTFEIYHRDTFGFQQDSNALFHIVPDHFRRFFKIMNDSIGSFRCIILSLV